MIFRGVVFSTASRLCPHGVDQSGQPRDLARAGPPVDHPFAHRLVYEGGKLGQCRLRRGLVLRLHRLPHTLDHGFDIRLDVTVLLAAGFILSHPLLGRFMNSQYAPPSFNRLLKNAHLLRFSHPSSLRSTSRYTSLLRISMALHLGIFEQPTNINFLKTL